MNPKTYPLVLTLLALLILHHSKSEALQSGWYWVEMGAVALLLLISIVMLLRIWKKRKEKDKQ